MTAGPDGPLAVHLAPGHVPFDTRVFHKEARTLADAGYRVVVVAPHDRHEVVDGVEIVPLPRTGSRPARFALGPVRMWRLVRRLEADIYHLHDFEAWPVGLLLALAGRTVVVDSHEDYPRLVHGRGWIPRRLRRPLAAAVRLAERVVVRRVAAVISAEDEGAKRFPADRTLVVHNYALTSEFPAGGTALQDRAPVAAYVGDLTEERGTRVMVEAVGGLPDDLGARLLLAGRMATPGLHEALEATPAWERVDFLGFVDRAGVRAALARARVGVVVLQPIPKFTEGAVPVKLFEYLAAGLPVVASDFPVIRAIADRTGGCVLVDPEDVDAVRAAIEALLRDPERAARLGREGRAAVLARYTWESEGAKLLSLYERLTARRPVAVAGRAG